MTKHTCIWSEWRISGIHVLRVKQMAGLFVCFCHLQLHPIFRNAASLLQFMMNSAAIPEQQLETSRPRVHNAVYQREVCQ